MLPTVRKQIEAALPDAQVIDFKEGNPALSRGPGERDRRS